MQSDNWRVWLPNCSNCSRHCRKVIICANEVFSVGDTKFAKTIMIPNDVLVDDIPENNEESNNNSDSEHFNIQEQSS